MPNIKSAKKRVKVSATKTLQNRIIKGNLKSALKAANAAIADNAADKAEVAKAAFKTIDQSAAKGIIHKNNAANKKSALAKNLNALKAAPAKAEEPKAEEVKEEAKAAPVAEAAAPAAEEKPKKTRAKKAKAEDAE